MPKDNPADPTLSQLARPASSSAPQFCVYSASGELSCLNPGAALPKTLDEAEQRSRSELPGGRRFAYGVERE